MITPFSVTTPGRIPQQLNTVLDYKHPNHPILPYIYIYIYIYRSAAGFNNPPKTDKARHSVAKKNGAKCG